MTMKFDNHTILKLWSLKREKILVQSVTEKFAKNWASRRSDHSGKRWSDLIFPFENDLKWEPLGDFAKLAN